MLGTFVSYYTKIYGPMEDCIIKVQISKADKLKYYSLRVQFIKVTAIGPKSKLDNFTPPRPPMPHHYLKVVQAPQHGTRGSRVTWPLYSLPVSLSVMVRHLFANQSYEMKYVPVGPGML